MPCLPSALSALSILALLGAVAGAGMTTLPPSPTTRAATTSPAATPPLCNFDGMCFCPIGLTARIELDAFRCPTCLCLIDEEEDSFEVPATEEPTEDPCSFDGTCDCPDHQQASIRVYDGCPTCICSDPVTTRAPTTSRIQTTTQAPISTTNIQATCAPYRPCNCRPGAISVDTFDRYGCRSCSCKPVPTTTPAPTTTNSQAQTTVGPQVTTNQNSCSAYVPCNCRPGAVPRDYLAALFPTATLAKRTKTSSALNTTVGCYYCRCEDRNAPQTSPYPPQCANPDCHECQAHQTVEFYQEAGCPKCRCVTPGEPSTSRVPLTTTQPTTTPRHVPTTTPRHVPTTTHRPMPTTAGSTTAPGPTNVPADQCPVPTQCNGACRCECLHCPCAHLQMSKRLERPLALETASEVPFWTTVAGCYGCLCIPSAENRDYDVNCSAPAEDLTEWIYSSWNPWSASCGMAYRFRMALFCPAALCGATCGHPLEVESRDMGPCPTTTIAPANNAQSSDNGKQAFVLRDALTGPAMGLIVAGIVLLLLVVAAIVVALRRRQSRHVMNELEGLEYDDGSLSLRPAPVPLHRDSEAQPIVANPAFEDEA
ncbi:uncharacterized protein MONBRDRAFT_30044 [Monosiga brevicollis MX1]|uniref:Antistasin-like domain-containing protein n=1 Tax=Monosiga brevicollis TaxID=81824 RepID=A9VCV3_MONBE|nr:uncharacterized protein MONBRDRAFT_30044 [Monosiga brevicollis MX1]EDQ84632.1 predicted protein [Monosiga brevicollis MX1]|eukprot:XP_001750536.1 hypothetical protein [Monosiga brevicollis MX1]